MQFHNAHQRLRCVRHYPYVKSIEGGGEVVFWRFAPSGLAFVCKIVLSCLCNVFPPSSAETMLAVARRRTWMASVRMERLLAVLLEKEEID